MFIALLTDLVNGFSHTIYVCLSNLKSEIQFVFITFKNFTTIHSQLSKTNVLEFVKLYVPNKTEDLNLGFFNMIAKIK